MTETVVTVQEAPHNNAAKPNNADGQTGSLSWLRINVDYWKTVPGIIKCVQLVSETHKRFSGGDGNNRAELDSFLDPVKYVN